MRGWLATFVMIGGCSSVAPCATELADAAEPVEAASDAASDDDAALACDGRGHVYLLDVNPGRGPCRDDLLALSVNVFDEAGRDVALAEARCVVNTLFADLGSMPAGRYDLAIRYGDAVYAG